MGVDGATEARRGDDERRQSGPAEDAGKARPAGLLPLPFRQFHRQPSAAKREAGAKNGCDEKIVLACLLHDISVGGLIRADHGYWAAQMIAPYVDEEVAWAVQQHQALRFFADESVGYDYPEAYNRFFGADYACRTIRRSPMRGARKHRWYMSGRAHHAERHLYLRGRRRPSIRRSSTDVIGRHFRQPEEGLGFDNSPVAHMWRTMIWPNNFLAVRRSPSR